MSPALRESLPILDLSLATDPHSKPQFLQDLKTYLLDIGFFYITNLPLKDDSIFDEVVEQSHQFFNLPLEKKLEVEMTNSKHFLGYTKLGNEITAGNLDWREQIDIATELPEPVIDSPDEVWKNIEGPNLWPDSKAVPNFKPVFNRYIEDMSDFSIWFIDLIREALGLPPGAFDKFFQKPRQQCKLKSIKYPDLQNFPEIRSQILQQNMTANNAKVNDTQGVGEHKDSDFITYIYQPTSHTSLEVQNFAGDWIKVPPLPNTLVVAVGQTLEAITQGVCLSTIHRVLTPQPGEGDRLSIPFFQTISIASYKQALQLPESLIQERVTRDKVRAAYGSKIGFQFQIDNNDKPVGWFVLLNRIKSHQDVAKRWYPDLLDQVLEEVRRHS